MLYFPEMHFTGFVENPYVIGSKLFTKKYMSKISQIKYNKKIQFRNTTYKVHSEKYKLKKTAGKDRTKRQNKKT